MVILQYTLRCVVDIDLQMHLLGRKHLRACVVLACILFFQNCTKQTESAATNSKPAAKNSTSQSLITDINKDKDKIEEKKEQPQPEQKKETPPTNTTEKPKETPPIIPITIQKPSAPPASLNLPDVALPIGLPGIQRAEPIRPAEKNSKPPLPPKSSYIDIETLSYSTHDHHFIIRSPKFQNLQIIKNCFDYMFCKTYTQNFSPGSEDYFQVAKDYSVDIHISLNSDELKTFFHGCNVDAFEGTIELRDDKTMQPIAIPPLAVMKQINVKETEFLNQLAPAEISLIQDRASIESSKKLIQKYIDEEQYELALNQTLKDFKLTYCNYDVSYDELPGSICGQIDKGNLLMTIDMVQIKDDCLFIGTVRHEVEHIRQHNRVDQCKGITNFKTRTNKERSAYLNDLLNMDRICPEEADENFFDTTNGFRLYPEENPA
jgi:hypothetical protein